MSRKKKLIRNLVIIIVGFITFYYVGGHYFTKEACIEDTIKELYGNETEQIMEFTQKGQTKTLMFNPEQKTVSIVGTKRFLGLYHTASSTTGMDVDEQYSFDLFASYESDFGMVMFIYRNNPEIAYIEAKFEDDTEFVLDKWTKDFTGYLLNTEDWQTANYKAYDSYGELIEERQY